MEKNQEELLEFVDEATKVEQLTESEGWSIIKRDIQMYMSELSSRFAYLDPKTQEFLESRILYIASDKLIKMVEDYNVNNMKAKELLLKLATQSNTVVADVDNE